MKKLIVLIVAVVVILIVLKTIGVDTFVSFNSKHENNSGWIGDYELATGSNTPEDIVGFSLPRAASDIHTFASTEFSNDMKYKYNWLTALIPKDDFDNLISHIDVVYKPDLIHVLPDALICNADEFRQHWKVSNNINKDTFWGEDQNEETYRVFKYENGKMYIKKTTKYIVNKDDKGVLIYKKALKE